LKEVILGVDPGTNVTGIAVLCYEGNQLELPLIRIFDLKNAKLDLLGKLRAIYQEAYAVFETYHITALAIESPFYQLNVQSTLKIGYVQGLFFTLALQRDLAIYQYPPRKVKQMVTGNGAATKHMVAQAIWQQFPALNQTSGPISEDASDALAVALTHYFTTKNQLSSAIPPKKKKSAGSTNKQWKQFIASNPDSVDSIS
jgi:crossover junction endodeoxyribonuclease RuvC